MTGALLLTFVALSLVFSLADGRRSPADRFALTCERCRFGEHASCAGTIVIAGGHLEGVHRCACPARHNPVNTPNREETQP